VITKIIAQLKLGTITNVVPYGTKPLPAAPYVVVKPEIDGLGVGRGFRIIIHMLPGQIIALEDYRNITIPALLLDFTTTTVLDRHNRSQILIRQPDDNEIVTSNDDNTISLECLYLQPTLNFMTKGE